MGATEHAVRFEILARSAATRARLGRVTTPHGSFETPAFMPVATAATMKGLTPDQIASTGSQIILNNAYHLMLRPTAERIAHFGGTHEFMRWSKPILTDSGGFQAWSMTEGTKLTEEGVEFRSFVDGAKIMLSPERSIAVQNAIGADIIMAFDDCPPALRPERPSDDPQLSRKRRSRPEEHRKRLEEAIDRTARWLGRCIGAHARRDEQGLFGIVQGGTDPALRAESAELTVEIGFDGYAIGGLSVGETRGEMVEAIGACIDLLPADRPRYLMGVGDPASLVEAVGLGVDQFDCVLQTRLGRHGTALTGAGKLHVTNAKWALSEEPLDPTCPCWVCASHTRGYIRHLARVGEPTAARLVSVHNVAWTIDLMARARRAILEGRYDAFRMEVLAVWG